MDQEYLIMLTGRQVLGIVTALKLLERTDPSGGIHALSEQFKSAGQAAGVRADLLIPLE